MHGVPRAASAWPSDPAPPGRASWSKSQRLLRASEFASFSGPDVFWRGARRWISMSACMQPEPSDAGQVLLRDGPAQARGGGPDLMIANVRFGISISRRVARRAVARNMVKRVLREAARGAAARLGAAAAQRPAQVLLRLKAPLPAAHSASWSAVKAELRREADGLLEQFARELERSRRAPGPQPQASGRSAAGAPGAES